MNIKVEETQVEKEQPIKFPSILKNSESGVVILFLQDRIGMVLDSSFHTAGYVSCSWNSFYDNHDWKPFKGTVLISND